MQIMYTDGGQSWQKLRTTLSAQNAAVQSLSTTAPATVTKPDVPAGTVYTNGWQLAGDVLTPARIGWILGGVMLLFVLSNRKRGRK